MGIKSKILNIPSNKVEDSKDNIGDTLNYGENIADDLSLDKEGIILKMFQDLTGESGEYNFKNGSWDRLTVERYEKLKKIKHCFKIKIYGTDARKCEILSSIDDVFIEKVNSKIKDLSRITDGERDIFTVIFYFALAKDEILDDFIEVFDIWPDPWCNLDNLHLIKELDLKKIKKIKSYLKLKNENLVLDYDTINNRLSALDTIEDTIIPPLLKGVEIGQQNYVILNPNNFEYIRAEKVGENEYIINANMPSNPILARQSLLLLCEYLPKGAKIIEKKSLSGDSFRLIMHLFKDQKKHNLKVSVKMSPEDRVQLNSEGSNSKLSQLVIEKNIGEDPELFESDSKEDVEQILSEINKLIYKYTGDKNIYAELKKYEKEEGKITWGVCLPGFEIEKSGQ